MALRAGVEADTRAVLWTLLRGVWNLAVRRVAAKRKAGDLVVVGEDGVVVGGQGIANKRVLGDVEKERAVLSRSERAPIMATNIRKVDDVA